MKYKGISANAAGDKLVINIVYPKNGRRYRLTLNLNPKQESNWKAANTIKRNITDAVTLEALGKANALDVIREFFPEFTPHRETGSHIEQGCDVCAALNKWFDTHLKSLSYSSQISYGTSVRFLCKHFTNITINALKPSTFRDKISAWKDSGLTRRSIRNHMIPMNGMLNDAVTDESIPHNPYKLVKVKWSKEDRFRERMAAREEIDPWEWDEIKAIFEKNRPGQIINLFEFGIWSGLREGEIFALSLDKVNFVKTCVRVDLTRTSGRLGIAKTELSIRDVDLSRLPGAMAALQRQKEYTFFLPPTDTKEKGEMQFVFHNPNINRPWIHYSSLSRAFKTMCKNAGVRYRYPYQMRHTFASMMYSLGESPAWIAMQLGHKDETMVIKNYAKYKPKTAELAGVGGGVLAEQFWRKLHG